LDLALLCRSRAWSYLCAARPEPVRRHLHHHLPGRRHPKSVPRENGREHNDGGGEFNKFPSPSSKPTSKPDSTRHRACIAAALIRSDYRIAHPLVTPLAGHSLAGAAAPDCDATGVDRPHPRRAGIQIETIPEKSVLARSFGKISSMVTFNVTSRTPSSALDDSEPTLLLFNRGPGAVLVGVTEIFDRAQAMLLLPRRAP